MKAIVDKPESRAHGKTVYIDHHKGKKYYCRFTPEGKNYIFFKWELLFV